MKADKQTGDFLFEQPFGLLFPMIVDWAFQSTHKYFHTPPSDPTPFLQTLWLLLGHDTDSDSDNSKYMTFIHDYPNVIDIDVNRLGRIFFQIANWGQLNWPRTAPSEATRFVHSPLSIVRRALTQKDFIEFENYADTCIRAMIFEASLEFFNRNPPNQLERRDAIHRALNAQAISDAVAAIHDLNASHFSIVPTNLTQFIVCHYLASRQQLLLDFAPSLDIPELRDLRPQISSRSRFLASGGLGSKDASCGFALPRQRLNLFSAAEITNALTGIPIAIAGLPPVLAGGLRLSERGGAVIRISGRPGTGKTSFALALAAAMAPLGTKTVFLSCEEGPEDLMTRLQSVIPRCLSGIAPYSTKDFSWFAPHRLNSWAGGALSEVETFFNDMRQEYFGGQKVSDATITPPGLSPLLIVLDGVHELAGRRKALGEFVEKCRNTGALVLMLSAADSDTNLTPLDYNVDSVIRLDWDNLPDRSAAPTRRLILEKTRKQFSHLGAHEFEFGSIGLHIRPHIETVLKTANSVDPDVIADNEYYDFFSFNEVRKLPRRDQLVRVYPRSRILVTGRGPAGKFRFALSLVMSTLIRSAPRHFRHELPSKRRIYVLSFARTTNDLRDMVQLAMGKNNGAVECVVDSDMVSPGFTTPEELLDKILRTINSAIIDGNPYHAVILDGLHQIAAAHPRLVDSAVMWPVLLEILRRFGLTVVLTFSWTGDSSFGGEPSSAHATLYSVIADCHYHFDLSRTGKPEKDVKRVLVEAVSAYNQEPPSTPMFWNPKGCRIEPDHKKPAGGTNARSQSGGRHARVRTSRKRT